MTKERTITLERIAEYPIVTHDQDLTSRRLTDRSFVEHGLVPNISMAAHDSDVIKTFVALGFGVGIVASTANQTSQDRGLRLIEAEELFKEASSCIPVRRGRYLRSYVYRLLEICSPEFKATDLREVGAVAHESADTA